MALDRFPKKPCNFCGGTGHFSYACYKNPKVQARRNGLKKNGKYAKQWMVTRSTWIDRNPPPIRGMYWECYLKIHPWCPRLLYDPNNKPDEDELRRSRALPVTLDHVVSRSRDPSKRFNRDNLQPACIYCNEMKGSRSLDQVKGDSV